MEGDNVTFEYVYDFYGPSASWFAIYIGATSTFIVISNIFFTILTLSTPKLRENVANWFLVGLSISDQLHYLSHVVDAYAIYTGSINNRYWCSVSGAFVLITGTCSFGFPALIAADRYYKISTISQPSGFSLSSALFSKRATIPLIVSWFFIAAISNLPLMLNDAFGEDPSGFCGAKKFTSIPLLLGYEFSVVFAYFGSLVVTGVFYYRLAKWLKLHQTASTGNRQEVDYTRSIMRVMKIVTLMPAFLDGPVMTLTAMQMLLPEMPMWINRALVVPYFLSSAANPWLTIALVKQFRVSFLQLLFNAKKTVILNAYTVNRSTIVRQL
uniref:G-protein coupled receptors family 1 profile domain-containing protein n=1 Tax=Plectus sambesii TaxID=2011161 RepID=A0A914UND3_9BILA